MGTICLSEKDMIEPPKASFLGLPGEIRNFIYALLLTNTTSISTGPLSSGQIEPPTINVSILRVCRQTHSEAVGLLYTLNRFRAHPSYLASMPFLCDPARPVTSSSCTSLIRRFHIVVRLECDPFWTRSSLAKAFSGIDELEIEAWVASYGICGLEVLESFTSVRRVRKAKVRGSHVDQIFSDWLEGVMESDEDSECIILPRANRSIWQHGNR